MTREEEGQDGGEKGFPERGAFGEWVLFGVMCLLLYSVAAVATVAIPVLLYAHLTRFLFVLSWFPVWCLYALPSVELGS